MTTKKTKKNVKRAKLNNNKYVVARKLLLIVVIVVFYFLFMDFIVSDLIMDRWLGLYDKLDEGVTMLIDYVFSIVVLLGMTFFLNKRGILAFSWSKLGKGLFMGLASLVISSLTLISNISSSLSSGMAHAPLLHAVSMTIAVVFGIGIAEELLFRGLVQNILSDIFGKKTRKAVIWTVIITGLLFGAAHLTNINVEGANWSYVATQALVVCGMGMIYAAIYARSGSLWAVALLHGLWDFGSMVTNAWFVTEADLLPFEQFAEYPVVLMLGIGIIVCSVWVGYAMFLLREKKQKEYLE
ncbi:CPBP family intramembrane metalloprotease [Candidatus Saccharibacteria bacterium]|nr:CPBP family intramembrane metalloprotease [Candidatus Saccharibacteria bacterium]